MREEEKGKREEGREGAVCVEHRAFWLPKAGAGAEEYEDAFAFSEKVEEGTFVRVAVADGATESAFARRWANLLADRFAERGAAALTRGLQALQKQWAATVEERADALPWYGAAKAEAGAYAALLGLTLHRPEGEEGSWQAASVGDCNAFHLRGDRLVQTWPHEHVDDFGTRPALVPSRPDAPGVEAGHAEGRWQRGDAFVLATDAAAAWLLRTDPARALRWEAVTFAEVVRQARVQGELQNDDVTVVTIRTA